mgnify:CR=1 FL=1
MRLGQITGSAFITAFSGAAMPGPVLAAAIFYAAGPWGALAGPVIMLGHLVLEISLVLALTAGLARWLSRPGSPLVRIIGVVGGLTLLLMAYDMFRGLPHLSMQAATQSPQNAGPFTAGILLSATNPYFWIWWATIGLGMFGPAMAARGRRGVAAFYLGHYSADLVWYTLVSLLIATGRSLLSDGVFRALIGCCALMLVLFGVRFVLFGLRPTAAVAPAGPTDATAA